MYMRLYGPGHIALLILAVAIACLGTFFTIMTAGFGADPAHNVPSAAMEVVLVASLAFLPVALLMIRWPGIAEIVSWVECCLCFLSLLMAAGRTALWLLFWLMLGLIARSMSSRTQRS